MHILFSTRTCNRHHQSTTNLLLPSLFPFSFPRFPLIMGGDDRAVLYDAVGQIWLEFYGGHVHVGYYENPKQQKTKPWQEAQFDYIDAMLEVAGVKQATQCVDLGCGYGGTAVYVAQRLNCKAVGVNISPFQVQAANELAKEAGFNSSQVQFVVGDALAPALPDGEYDLVLAVESSTYMPDKDKFVQQLARLVRPRGTVILADFCRKPGPMTKELSKRMDRMDEIFATAGNWKSAEDFKAMMESNGLRITTDKLWTKNIRGFWKVGTLELLFRKDHPKQSAADRIAKGLKRSLRVGWLLVTGGPKVLKMTAATLSGAMGSVVQGGLDGGDIEYHVIVAKKP